MAHWMPDMTGPEIEALLGRRPVIVPVGSLEQHGPHLPADTDSAIARWFALAIATEIDGLVAPDLGYGYRSQPVSGGGEIFPGTTSLAGATLCSALYDILCAFARHGQLEFVLVNGHYENSAFVVEAANLAVLQHPGLRVVAINWWEIARADRLDKIFGGEFPGWAAEHAGVVETSLLMHLDPMRVRIELIDDRTSPITPPNYTVLPERPGLVDPSGVLRTAHGSSAAIGREIFDHVVELSTSILRNELPSATTRERQLDRAGAEVAP